MLLIFFSVTLFGCAKPKNDDYANGDQDNGYFISFSENTSCPINHQTAEDVWEKYADVTEIFTITMRIHEDMPEFTFHRIVSDCTTDMRYLERHWEFTIFSKHVTIVIEDEYGNIIQNISGLTQDDKFICNEIHFEDFNFDGYLDMRLLRWHETAVNLSAYEYFWLWDTEKTQFVLNEQLMEIGIATYLVADQDTKQIRVFHRSGGGNSRLFEFYEYHNGNFVLVNYEIESW
jgi:hypothetical protein